MHLNGHILGQRQGLGLLVGTGIQLCNGACPFWPPERLGKVPAKVDTVTLNDLGITDTIGGDSLLPGDWYI